MERLTLSKYKDEIDGMKNGQYLVVLVNGEVLCTVHMDYFGNVVLFDFQCDALGQNPFFEIFNRSSDIYDRVWHLVDGDRVECVKVENDTDLISVYKASNEVSALRLLSEHDSNLTTMLSKFEEDRGKRIVFHTVHALGRLLAMSVSELDYYWWILDEQSGNFRPVTFLCEYDVVDETPVFDEEAYGELQRFAAKLPDYFVFKPISV